MIVGQRIKGLREDRNLTQEQLGKILNLNKTTISHYENDSRIPDIELLIQMANYFEVDLNYLLGLDHHIRSGKRSLQISNEEMEFIIELRKIRNYRRIMNNPKRYIQILDKTFPNDRIINHNKEKERV